MRTRTFKHTIKYPGIRETFVHNLYLVADSYADNGSLAVTVMEVNDDGTEDYFDTVTVNIPWGDAGGNRAYVDTNNCSWAEKMLSQHRFAKDTGERQRSGYCVYPLYEFDLSKFDKKD